ncbi:Dabb family protein [Paenibacillus doosanensis]|uniref:Dabb family protein n=1 Tax=Paenibacillus doosanensis TaxID=1229154 RepID=UPI00217F294D|nr:Dabb family protein [Paenibacillus doosanensis]MCS7464472.1 Dabb family protein [Paenibacillus doosanensis]
MIDHIVLVKFGESTTQKQLQEVVSRYKALKGELEGVIDIQAGINFSEKNQGYQILLSVRFENKAALEAYGPHPKHQAVAAFIREVGRLDSIVMDIEI